ncbi:MAG: hypothetical protein GX974_00850 [Clostridiales bacterium]|nr:hypothetical protein [Clostridiales bacterium]
MQNNTNAQEIIERTNRFYESSDTGIALIQVRNIQSIQPPKLKAMNEWDFPNDLYEYLDARLERFLSYWDKRGYLGDDLIPSIHPWFGIAEHSAFVGGEVEFTKETSYHHPVIKDWDDFGKLELREDNPWIRMVLDGQQYLLERSEGRYAVKLRGADGPMDIANAVRGNELFVDFYEYPDEVHRLMEFCTDAVKWTLEHQKKTVGQLYGGVITGFDIWLPGNSIGQLSEDASTMCSPDIYREFGLPYTQKLVSEYDHAFMHTHALGKHNIPVIAEMDKINVMEISSDPNRPRAIEIYKDLEKELEDKVVVVQLTYDEIIENLDFLKNKKTIIWYSATDMDDAKRAIKLVRSELKF